MRNPYTVSCSVPDLDHLAAKVESGSHHKGVTDPVGRAEPRAEADGIIAHICGLTEGEFAYVLSTFPLMAEPVKFATLKAYRHVECGATT